MSKELILENDAAILWYYPDYKIVHHEIKRYAYGKNFRDLLLRGSELLKEKGAQKWLSDDRNNGAVGQEDIDWGNNYWFPQTVKNGWKYWAMVHPEKLIGQMNIKRITENYANKGIIVNIFSNPDEALKWLIEQ